MSRLRPLNPSPLVAAEGSFLWNEDGTVLTEEDRLGQGGLVEDLNSEGESPTTEEFGLTCPHLGAGLL